MVPDQILSSLIEMRLKQSDCQMNGWVLDGFPSNELQVNLLRAMQIKPSHVILLDQPESDSVTKLRYRKIDIATGNHYNLKMLRLSDQNLVRALKEAQNDTAKLQKFGFGNIDKDLLNTLYMDNSQADPIDVAVIKRLGPCPEDQGVIVKKRYAIWKM